MAEKTLTQKILALQWYSAIIDLRNILLELVSLSNSSVKNIVAGTNISIDDTDPQNPIISATSGSTATVPTLQEVVDEGNLLFDSNIYLASTSNPYNTTLINNGLVINNLDSGSNTYISNKGFLVVESITGTSVNIDLPTPTGFSGVITFPDVGSDVKTVAYTEDIPANFEVQITQTGTDAPNIVPGSIIGATDFYISTSHESTGYVRITSDLPIFANAKDYTRSSDNRQTFFTSNSGASFLSFYNILVEDDYNIGIEMYYLNAGTPIPADGIFTTPVLIRIPFKQ